MFLSPVNDDLAYDNSKLKPACTTGNKTEGLISDRIVKLLWLKNNSVIFLFTILALLTKSILFIGLINNDNATSFDLVKAFHSFSSPPPLTVYVSLVVVVLSFAFFF